MLNTLAKIGAFLIVLSFPLGAMATDLNGQWANSPNAAWYKAQVPTPETLKIYEIEWGSCCDNGDVCQECVVHHQANKPPFSDTWWYEKDGKIYQLPPHIVEYVPWTPTGKPVLFRAFKRGENE